MSSEGRLSRSSLFAGLTLIGFLNGSSEHIRQAIVGAGLLPAALNTFEISIISWGALAAAIVLLIREPPEPLRKWDDVVAALAALLFILPVPALSWIALCGMAAWLYLSSSRASSLRRGAGVIFALTIPGFWARLTFDAMSDVILRIDSTLVGLVVGTTPNGNLVPFRDGSGSLFIEPGCSSFSNMSLAILCMSAFANWRGEKWSTATLAWICLACIAVIAINVFRISLMGLFPVEYDLLHGPLGATAASWLTAAAILAIALFRFGQDAAPLR